MKRSPAYHAYLRKQAWKKAHIIRLQNERSGALAPGAKGPYSAVLTGDKTAKLR